MIVDVLGGGRTITLAEREAVGRTTGQS